VLVRALPNPPNQNLLAPTLSTTHALTLYTSVSDFVSYPNEVLAVEGDEKEKEKEEGKGKGKEKEVEKVFRRAGEEWLLPGPCTYVPRVEVEVKDVVSAIIVKPDQAVHLRAITDFVDSEVLCCGCCEGWCAYPRY